MLWVRALIYAIVAGGILFGLITAASLYFMDNMGLHAVLGTLLPFVIPGAGILAFLMLTEKSRHKPWVIEEQKVLMERYAKKDPKASGPRWTFIRSFMHSCHCHGHPCRI